MRFTFEKLYLFAAFVLVLSLPSCKKEPVEILSDEPVEITLSKEQESVIQSGNDFAFEVFRKVIEKKNSDGNIIISPLSISAALSMTLNGANGTTRDEMAEALGLAGLTPEKINTSYKDLTEALLAVDKRILITIANSVWVENNFVVKKPFSGILTNYYGAESKSFDSSNPLAHQAVNAWIEDKTNGLIKDMLDKLSSDAVMLLVNAIYFKGKWNSQFDKADTKQRTFYKADGSVAEVPAMSQTHTYRIYDGDGFIMAELPYGQGNYVMDVLLPDKDKGSTSTLLPALTSVNFNTWIGKFREIETELYLPKFKYGYKEKMKDILAAMGMESAFSDNADFSNITDLSVKINEVTHQAFIETNEEGTEAAAVTVVEIVLTSMPMTFTLNIDHPFIYIIREVTTNSILFIGRVDDPLAS